MERKTTESILYAWASHWPAGGAASPAPPASSAQSAPCPAAASARSSLSGGPRPSHPPICQVSRCPHPCLLPAAAWGMSHSAPGDPRRLVRELIDPKPIQGSRGSTAVPTPKATQDRWTHTGESILQIHEEPKCRMDLLYGHPLPPEPAPTVLHKGRNRLRQEVGKIKRMPYTHPKLTVWAMPARKRKAGTAGRIPRPVPG